MAQGLAVLACVSAIMEDPTGPLGVDVLVTTLAGDGAGYLDGIGTAARFYRPQGCAVASDGTFVYVADTENHVIRRIAVQGGSVTTLAGLPGGSGSMADGVASAAAFTSPRDIYVDPADGDHAYVADYGNCAVQTSVFRSPVADSLQASCVLT